MAKGRFEGAAGPSQRQLRVGEAIRRALSTALMRGEVCEPALDGVSVTVTEVRAAPDLKRATVYVMPLGGGEGEAVVAALTGAKGALRQAVNRATKLKFSPDLRFLLDETFDQVDRTRQLLSETQVRRDLE